MTRSNYIFLAWYRILANSQELQGSLQRRKKSIEMEILLLCLILGFLLCAEGAKDYYKTLGVKRSATAAEI